MKNRIKSPVSMEFIKNHTLRTHVELYNVNLLSAWQKVGTIEYKMYDYRSQL